MVQDCVSKYIEEGSNETVWLEGEVEFLKFKPCSPQGLDYYLVLYAIFAASFKSWKICGVNSLSP